MKIFVLCFLLSALRADAWLFDRLCTFELTEPTGLLTSPNYPNNYPTPLICTYKIMQPLEHKITLLITDTDLGWNKTETDTNDRLTIYDGDNETFRKIDTLYGSEYFIPGRQYSSSTNHLFLEFKTFSEAEIHRGFHVVYQSTDVQCGGLYTQNNGTIRHPTHGTQYKNNEHCKWIIQAPPGHVIRFKWISFNTESADRVTLKEWKNNAFTQLKLHSGTTVAAPYNSTDRTVYIDFDSDSSVVSSGFRVNYTFHDVSNFYGYN